MIAEIKDFFKEPTTENFEKVKAFVEANSFDFEDLDFLEREEIEDFEERSSIMEHDGGLPREEADIQAFLIVLMKRVKK